MTGFINPDGSALAGGLSPGSVGQSLALDASGNLKVISENSATLPVVTEDQIRAYIVNGQGFSASSGKQNSTASGTVGLAVFNPVNSAKNVLIYSVRFFSGNNGTHQLMLITADPAYTAITPQNMNFGSAIAAAAVTEYTNTAITPPGTAIDSYGALATTESQFLPNGECLLLPARQAGILGIFVGVVANTNVWSVTVRWIEF